MTSKALSVLGQHCHGTFLFLFGTARHPGPAGRTLLADPSARDTCLKTLSLNSTWKLCARDSCTQPRSLGSQSSTRKLKQAAHEMFTDLSLPRPLLLPSSRTFPCPLLSSSHLSYPFLLLPSSSLGLLFPSRHQSSPLLLPPLVIPRPSLPFPSRIPSTSPFLVLPLLSPPPPLSHLLFQSPPSPFHTRLVNSLRLSLRPLFVCPCLCVCLLLCLTVSRSASRAVSVAVFLSVPLRSVPWDSSTQSVGNGPTITLQLLQDPVQEKVREPDRGDWHGHTNCRLAEFPSTNLQDLVIGEQPNGMESLPLILTRVQSCRSLSGATCTTDRTPHKSRSPPRTADLPPEFFAHVKDPSEEVLKKQRSQNLTSVPSHRRGRPCGPSYRSSTLLSMTAWTRAVHRFGRQQFCLCIGRAAMLRPSQGFEEVSRQSPFWARATHWCPVFRTNIALTKRVLQSVHVFFFLSTEQTPVISPLCSSFAKCITSCYMAPALRLSPPSPALAWFDG